MEDSKNPILNRFYGDNPVTIADHKHNGYDASRILWEDLSRKRIFVTHTIIAGDAATAGNFGVIWIAPYKCVLASVKVSYAVTSSSGTLQIEKLSTTQAPDSGTTMLQSAISLSGTANTVISGTPSNTPANRTIDAGDRICLKDAGTLTGLSNLTVLLEFIIV